MISIPKPKLPVLKKQIEPKATMPVEKEKPKFGLWTMDEQIRFKKKVTNAPKMNKLTMGSQ